MASGSVNLPEGYTLDQPGLPEGYTLEEGPETSAIGSLGRGALEALPFGLKGAAGLESQVGSGKYEDYLKELDQLIESDKSQHPVAHLTGEVAGSVAPFAIPGVGEALGAETMAGRAGIGAGIGAVQGASNTRAPLTSNEGLGDIARSAGLGAVLNPALGAVGDVIANKAGELAPKLQDFAANKMVQTGGFRPSMLGRMEPGEITELGNFMMKNDLGEGDMTARLQKAEVLKNVYGSKIGQMGKLAATVEDPIPYAEALKESSLKYSGSGTPEAQQLGKTYLGGAQDIETQLPAGSSYADIQNLKEMYGDLAFAPDHSVKNSAAAEVYNTLKQMQKDLISKSPEEYQGLMKGYSQSSDIVNGFQKQLGQSRSGGGTGGMGMGIRGLIRQIPGMKNPATALPAGIGLAALGHPYVGAMAALGPLSNPQAMSNMAGAGAEAMGKLATSNLPSAALTSMGEHAVAPELAHHAAMHQVHGAIEDPKIPQQYIPVFQRATQNIKDPAERQKQMTITDFVLQSRDPNYSKAKQAMGESSNGAF